MRETYELRVGLFILVALIMLFGGWGWLKGLSLVDPPQTFWVRFHDVAGLSNNATINVQGVRVGNVDQISFKLPDGLTDAPDANAEEASLPKVYCHMKIAGLRAPISKSAEVTIQTLGLVGAKYVEITLPTQKIDHHEAINPQIVVDGRDPVRVELVVNNIAKKLNQAADAISSDEAASALKHISQASAKLDKNLDSMPALTASLKKASDAFESTSRKFSKTAERTEVVADSANRFFSEGKSSFASVHTLADGMTQTNRKLGRLLDNPAFSKDLKDTVELAHQTAISVQSAISQLNGTVQDKDLRKDLLSMLSSIKTSSDDIRQSMQVVSHLADDQGLRTDVKGIIADYKSAVGKANTMLSDPGFKADITQTMARVKTAASDVDLAARQMHQILEKRAPLMHMMFGKPGEIGNEKTRETIQDGTSVKSSGSVTK